MKTYYELRLQINPEMEEIISDIFFENFDCEGIVLAEETYKDLEMVSTTEGTLKVFLGNNESYEDLLYDIENVLDLSREEFLKRGLSEEDLGSWDFVLEEKENEDWSKKWKESWDVTHVTDKIAVVPDWLTYQPKPDEIEIRLEPGCAFGTGTHQTTQLCMKALEKYMHAGDKVADIGMGSGILQFWEKIEDEVLFMVAITTKP
jgi:ribosomal protein L11 methyltransferase